MHKLNRSVETMIRMHFLLDQVSRERLVPKPHLLTDFEELELVKKRYPENLLPFKITKRF